MVDRAVAWLKFRIDGIDEDLSQFGRASEGSLTDRGCSSWWKGVLWRYARY